jgi:hypothetical protein
MRKIIIHYHLFKNAGTSVDVLLERNFGSRWGEYEGSGKKLLPDELGAYLTANPQLEALSSHNALLPLPQLPDTQIFPILFLRHPIDRIRSVYEFERTQDAKTEGARMAKRRTFSGYIEWRRARWFDYSTRNFQTWRLAQGTPVPFGFNKQNILSRALDTMEQLPVIGLVEEFALSIKLFERMLREYFPDLAFEAVRANVTQPADSNLTERLARIRAELGPDQYARLVQENEMDTKIHAIAHERLTKSALETASDDESTRISSTKAGAG